jgi:hypothetical protein
MDRTSFPTDHWAISDKFKNAGVDSASHDASLFIGCIPVVANASLLVQPASPMAIEPAQRAVTVILDNGPRFQQSWFSEKDEYGISDDEAGYSDLISMMKAHQSVEIVLHDSGKEIDHHTFTLKGATAAIDATLAACGRKPIP